MKGDSELAALVAAVDGDARLEVELGEALGRFRRRRERDAQDMEIAQLIPRGVDAVIERFGGSRRNNFRRAGKGRYLLRLSAIRAMGTGTDP